MRKLLLSIATVAIAGMSLLAQHDYAEAVPTSEEQPDPTVTTVSLTNLSELMSLYPVEEGTADFTVEYTGQLVVVAMQKSHLWLTDMQGSYIQIYSKAYDRTYSCGEVVNGFKGVPTNIKGKFQITDAVVGEYLPDQGIKAVEPVEVGIAEVTLDMQNHYVRLRDVTVIRNTAYNYTITDAGGSLTMYDTYSNITELYSVKGILYDVCGFVDVYNGQVQIVPLEVYMNVDTLQIENLSELNDYYPDKHGVRNDIAVEYRKQLTVVASVGKNLWLTDEQGGFVYLYGVNRTCKVGEVVAGFNGIPSNYNGTYEIQGRVGDAVAEAGTRTVVPDEIMIEDVANTPQAHYVLIRGVEISGNSRRYKISDGVASAIMYDQIMTFLEFVPEDGCRYDVLGFIGASDEDAPAVFPLTITKEELQACAAPVFTPTPGEYKNVTTVMATSATEGAIIYYTINGSEPDENSATFSSPVELNENGIYEFRAVAMADGYAPSEVVTVVYDINTSSGIEDVRVVGDADYEYFNLHGMPVAKPVRGMYIGRRDGKVVKYVVK